MGVYEKIARDGIDNFVKPKEDLETMNILTSHAESIGIKSEDSSSEFWNEYFDKITKDIKSCVKENMFRFNDKNYYKIITERVKEIHEVAEEIQELSEHNVDKMYADKDHKAVSEVDAKMEKAQNLLNKFRSELNGEPSTTENIHLEINNDPQKFSTQKLLEYTAYMLKKLSLDIISTIEPTSPNSHFSNN